MDIATISFVNLYSCLFLSDWRESIHEIWAVRNTYCKGIWLTARNDTTAQKIMTMIINCDEHTIHYAPGQATLQQNLDGFTIRCHCLYKYGRFFLCISFCHNIMFLNAMGALEHRILICIMKSVSKAAGMEGWTNQMTSSALCPNEACRRLTPTKIATKITNAMA